MKFAFLNIYNGIINRGAEAYVFELANRLAKNNEVDVYQSGDSTGREKYNVKTVKVDWDWNKKSGDDTFLSMFFLDYWSLMILKWSIKVSREIIKGKYDGVMTVNGGWEPLILRIVTWFCGTKLYISGQSGIGRDDRLNLYTMPDVFIALSSKALDWAKRVNPFIKSVYIPNGVDLNVFKPEGEKYKTSLRHPIVYCDSAFTKQKRIDLVIKAMAKLGKGSLLVAGGGGDLKKYLENLGKETLSKNFKLISVDYKEIPSVLRSVDLFTLASTPSEAFGIVIVQALALNLPVVVNDDPIRREIVGMAGLFVDPTDTYAYAKTIKKALSINWKDHKELARLNLENPRERAKRFDWDEIAKQYLLLFKNI